VSEQRQFGELVGDSVAMREVYAVLERAAPLSSPVLVLGETGTGKDVVARSLHQLGPRANMPFVVLDCSAIPADLAESHLFGHVRGAFTGAISNQPGAFENAHGGTLFLDELGELPLDLQPKLLRALETHEVRRVGGREPRKVDVRVIAGTHRDLAAMIADGRFRADLYYRLAVVEVLLPPLREHLEDLPRLVEKLFADLRLPWPGPLEGANLSALRAHAWPGNVRELRNVVQRALVALGAAPSSFGELALGITPERTTRARATRGAPEPPALDFFAGKEKIVEEYERVFLTQLFDSTGGNIAEAARRAGINRRHLYDLLRKYGLRT
jgi:DNA-binding NtrC family response regulator